jgi:hypothetical protein
MSVSTRQLTVLVAAISVLLIWSAAFLAHLLELAP